MFFLFMFRKNDLVAKANDYTLNNNYLLRLYTRNNSFNWIKENKKQRKAVDRSDVTMFKKYLFL